MGRPLGSRNKATKYREKILSAQGVLMPLSYMLEVMRDPEQPDQRRDDMAKAAAPYVHPRLASVVHKGLEAPLTLVDTINFGEFAPEERQVLRQAAQFLLEKQKALEDRQD